MEQIAMVKSVQGNGMAVVAVQRGTACGAAHNCAECNGCETTLTRKENLVTAYNDAEAKPGDMVRVCSENATFFKTAAIVYILPLVLALVFYGVSSFLPFGGNEMLRALCAGIGFVAGVLVAVPWDRHMKRGHRRSAPGGAGAVSGRLLRPVQDLGGALWQSRPADAEL